MSFRTTSSSNLAGTAWVYILSSFSCSTLIKSHPHFLSNRQDITSLQLPEQDLSNSRVQSHETSWYSPSGWGLKDFQETFPTSFTHPGGSPPLRVTRQHENDGLADAVNEKSTYSFQHPYSEHCSVLFEISLRKRKNIVQLNSYHSEISSSHSTKVYQRININNYEIDAGYV